MSEPASLRVSIVYCAHDRQFVRELTVADGTSVAAAIRLSGIIEAAQLGDSDLHRTGIFNQRVDPATRLRDGDRVEIYRALRIDPKEARRRRVGPAGRK